MSQIFGLHLQPILHDKFTDPVQSSKFFPLIDDSRAAQKMLTLVYFSLQSQPR